MQDQLRALEGGGEAADEVFDVLCGAARQFANLMGLRDWSVEVTRTPPFDPDALATCQVADGRRHLRLSFARDFPSLPPEEQRHALVHELIHPHLASMDHTVREDLAGELGGAAYRLFRARFIRDLEGAVDALAGVIAPTLPLIKWD
jgi:hypothetical protein